MSLSGPAIAWARLRALQLLLFFAAMVLRLDVSRAIQCANSCSGRGLCLNGSPGLCDCFPGFIGVDCSLRLCPAGVAWYDFPSSSSDAHADYTECSNMGHCDRSTGQCVCRAGFTGAACDMMLCPLGTVPEAAKHGAPFYRLPCSGHGQCISLREVALLQDYIHYYDSTAYSAWDADKIYGCVCDSLWEGFDCSKRSCPKGDDPMTEGVDEVQLIDCTCSTCAGGVYVTVKNQRTSLLPFNTTAALLAYRLEQLSTVEKVTVTSLYGTTLCSSTGSVTEVKFLLPQGHTPAMLVTASTDLDATINVRTDGESSSLLTSATSVYGTREYVTCSNHGICHNDTGLCHCFDAFESSNGFGSSGSRGDCGYRVHTDVVTYLSNTTYVNSSCAVVDDSLCSGHGSCDELTATCVCDSGYGGAACSNKTCPYTLTWFGDIGSNHSTLSECGGVGECDGVTGVCFNCGGTWSYFNGTGCEYLSCPVSDEDAMCSGHGACLTLREIGLLRYNDYKELDPVYYDSPWDAEAVRGCLCERAISVDNQFISAAAYYDGYISFNASASATSNNYTLYNDTYSTRFYRGPYAFAATDYKSYDCSYVGCPSSDNPLTTGQFNAIQQLEFSSSFASELFSLTFRGNSSQPVACNATIEEMAVLVEEIYTIGSVTLWRSGNESTSLCDSSASAVLYIEFTTEFGDLPLMTASSSDITISTYQTGTKEDVECSAQGLCAETTGICRCRVGFGSSNGSSSAAGERGDCTFLRQFP